MRLLATQVVAIAFTVSTSAAAAPQAQPAAPRTDVYHVHFTKAVPGQAEALAKALVTPNPTAPMPDHFVVLRHQEGDDWDYCVIQHLGPKATVDAAPAAPNPARDLRAWHTDTFVSGPSWADFTRAMAIGGAGSTPNAVYTVGVFRAVPGHRDQLETSLNQPPASSKVQTGTAFFQHLEGSDWQFMTVTRYNSWQDLGTDRSQAAAAAASNPGGWAEIRQHGDFHRDTITDRIFPK